MSYLGSLGGRGSGAFGFEPLAVSLRSDSFLSTGCGILKFVAPTAWSVRGVSPGRALRDCDQELERLLAFAPLRPREDVEWGRGLTAVAGLRVGLRPRMRDRGLELLSGGLAIGTSALMISSNDGDRSPSSSIRSGLSSDCWVSICGDHWVGIWLSTKSIKFVVSLDALSICWPSDKGCIVGTWRELALSPAKPVTVTLPVLLRTVLSLFSLDWVCGGQLIRLPRKMGYQSGKASATTTPSIHNLAGNSKVTFLFEFASRVDLYWFQSDWRAFEIS